MGKLFTVSGIDGSGKSTCSIIIKDILESIGGKAVIVDAMKNGIFVDTLKDNSKYLNYDDLRSDLSPELLNLAWTSDLIYNYETNVRRYLNQGYNVILHRSELCCRVYSKLFSSQSNLVDSALDNYHFDYSMSFFVDTAPELALKRINERSCSKRVTGKETLSNLRLASDLYKEYLASPKYKHIHKIDGSLFISDIKKELEICIGSIICMT